jgi:hypothetical protein
VIDKLYDVRFQVLTAASIKMAVFWVDAPCGLVKFTAVSDMFVVPINNNIITSLMMEIESTSETQVNF